MTSTDNDEDLYAKRLERMKNDFLAAQQRRRGRTPTAAVRRDETGDGPDAAGPAADGPHGITTLRP